MVAGAVKRQNDYYRVVYALLASTVAFIALLLVGAEKAHSSYYLFLIYNLGLAYIAPLVALWLIVRLRKSPWLSFGNIVLTILWLAFLPNSFYMIADLIHAQASIGFDLLYNVVVITFCIFNSLVAGYISMYLIHSSLLKRFYYRNAHIIIGIILLLCSFAIYLGRYLRWDSWDLVINPAGLLFDISDSLTSPSTHPDLFSTVLSFFILLGSIYLVAWQLVRVLRKSHQLN